MPTRILILSQPRDIHAFAVRQALRSKGAEVTLWLTSDFPSLSCETVDFADSLGSIEIRSPELHLVNPDFDTIWNRRPSFVVDTTVLHEADIGFANTECSYFRKALFSLLSPQAFWVNRPEVAVQANRKIIQHRVALRVGLRMPRTLYSNDPVKIRRFLQQEGGRVAYKPFAGVPWRDEETYWVPFTSTVATKDLPSDPLLQATPGIYQALVPKAYELRTTVMGRQTFTARILSQDADPTKIDWRMCRNELKMEPYQLPDEVERLCIELVSELGLVFGCIDMIVTPEGDFVFLEVNEMGQFLFLETRAGLPVLDAFSEFLLSGSSEFRWIKDSPKISYSEVVGLAQEDAEGSQEGHVTPKEIAIWEGSLNSR